MFANYRLYGCRVLIVMLMVVNNRLCRCSTVIERLLFAIHRLSRCSVLTEMLLEYYRLCRYSVVIEKLLVANYRCIAVAHWLKCHCLKNQTHQAPMFLLAFMIFVFIVTLVEIKLASTAVGGNRGMETGEVHWLMELPRSSYILE